MAGQGAARGDREGAGGRMRHRARLLTARLRYGKAPTDLAGIARNSTILKGSRLHMVKPEWGTKRSCPKCATRFYDLGKANPVTCIECGTAWEPEPNQIGRAHVCTPVPTAQIVCRL